MFTSEIDGLWPQVGQNVSLINVFGEFDKRRYRMTTDNRERAFPSRRHVLVVFADRDEPKLVPGEEGNVSPPNNSASPGLLAEVESTRTLHKRVVDIKESQNRVLARLGRRYLVHPHYSKVVPTKRLTLIGKPGCHLCDDARLAITKVIAELPAAGSVELTEQSILDDEALHSRYWDEIPVVLINDRVHTIWRVDPERLRAALLEEIE